MKTISEGWNDLQYVAKCSWIMVPTTLATANLYVMSATYGHALRFAFLGLYLLIFAYTLCLYFHPNNNRTTRLHIGGLVVAECYEMFAFISCKFFLDPLTGDWETLQELWGAGVAKSTCERAVGFVPRWLPVVIFLCYYGYLGWTIFLRKASNHGHPDT